MPVEDTKILEFNQYQKSNKAAFVIYVDPECLIEKIDECKNNRESPYTAKESEHIPSDFSILHYHNLKSYKISMMYAVVNIAWKSFVNL